MNDEPLSNLSEKSHPSFESAATPTMRAWQTSSHTIDVIIAQSA
jgi:hypothetical protein